MSRFFQKEFTLLLSLTVFSVIGLSITGFYFREDISRVLANDSIQTSVYQDTNADGQVDRIQWNLDETILSCVYEPGDWVVDYGGDMNIVAVTGVSCSGLDGILNIEVSAEPNITGSLLDPVISYTNQGNPDDIVLASGPMTDKVGTPASDNASPVVIPNPNNPQYVDANGDGTVDLVYIFFTEPVDYNYDASDWSAVANDLTGFSVVDCNACTGVSPLELLVSANPGVSGVSGGTEPTIEYNFLVNPIFDGVGNALTSFGPFSLFDNAAPTMFSAMYLDNDLNGTVDMIRTTWSENVTMSGSTLDDWHIEQGNLRPVFVSAPDDLTPGLTLDILVSADPNETGNHFSDIRYDNNDGNNSVVDSPLPAGLSFAIAVTDGASPVVLSWSLNVTDKTLTLNFTEPVDASTLDPTVLTIQDAATATQSVTLTGGTTASANGSTIVVDLLDADVTALLANPALATNSGNTYLRFTADLIDDLAANIAVARINGSALQVSQLTVPATGGSHKRSERISSNTESDSTSSQGSDQQDDSSDQSPSGGSSSPDQEPEVYLDLDEKITRAEAMKLLGARLGIDPERTKEVLKEKGIINKRIADTSLELRANFLAMVLKAKGISAEDLPDCDKSRFRDVPESKWYCPVVEYAREMKWFKKESKKKNFSPSAPVTRGWALEVLDRAF